MTVWNWQKSYCVETNVETLLVEGAKLKAEERDSKCSSALVVSIVEVLMVTILFLLVLILSWYTTSELF